MPTLPRAIRDSISETQRFASAFVGPAATPYRPRFFFGGL
jgi:hypothetical protein